MKQKPKRNHWKTATIVLVVICLGLFSLGIYLDKQAEGINLDDFYFDGIYYAESKTYVPTNGEGQCVENFFDLIKENLSIRVIEGKDPNLC
jgi:hypothetical protein